MKRALLALFLCGAVLLSGCAVLDSGNLLSIPELSPGQAELLRLVNAVTANSGWSVTAPSRGEDHSAMQFVDFYGDGVEEAVCFFRNTSERRLRVSVYTTTGPSGYSEMCSVETEGYAVDYAGFTDLDGDGTLELILAVGYEHGAIYGLEVYRVSNHSAGKVDLGTCLAYGICDLTGDGLEDIIVSRQGEEKSVKDPSELQSGTAELFSWVDGIATRLGRVPILSGRVGSAVVTCGSLNESMMGCVIETQGTLGDREVWMSNVLSWDGELVNLSAEALGSAADTARDLKLLCRDVDFDGHLEIPMCVSMPSSESGASAGEKYTLWYGFSEDDALVQKSVTYCFPGGNWYYIMPEGWNGSVYVKTGSMDGLSTVAFAADRNGRPNTLLTVYCVERNVSPKLPEGSFYLTSAGSQVYYALVGTPDELSPLEESLYVRSEAEVFERFITVDALGNAVRASEQAVIYD